MIRAAAWSDVFPVAELLEEASRNKSNAHICRSRANACISRGVKCRKSGRAYAFVWEEKEQVTGFLFATEQQAFELCEKITVMAVPFLVGKHGIELLKHLRRSTTKRIWLPVWGLNGHSLDVWARYLSRMKTRVVGHCYELL